MVYMPTEEQRIHLLPFLRGVTPARTTLKSVGSTQKGGHGLPAVIWHDACFPFLDADACHSPRRKLGSHILHRRGDVISCLHPCRPGDVACRVELGRNGQGGDGHSRAANAGEGQAAGSAPVPGVARLVQENGGHESTGRGDSVGPPSPTPPLIMPMVGEKVCLCRTLVWRRKRVPGFALGG